MCEHSAPTKDTKELHKLVTFMTKLLQSRGSIPSAHQEARIFFFNEHVAALQCKNISGLLSLIPIDPQILFLI
jgi:hypothetical protein